MALGFSKFNMKYTFFYLLLFSSFLASCQDKYDKIVRIPEVAEIEEKLKKDVLCDDAIITIDNEGNDGPTLKIILINSKDVTLDKPNEFKSKYSWNLSCVLVEHAFQPPPEVKWIEILLVEKTNFIIQAEKYYSQTYLLEKVISAIEKKKLKVANSTLSTDSIFKTSPSH
ncbi:hypothetical protein I5M27_00650 [Adhaeribacter sp. BT258]|uniref:Lipoprotein n=1 Tax=Adhaeribacter terrigena TaxID=2793070 RepID=A0ABS1BWN4_9BACT|nr:hypothetical protein [Adhaeribacter terrigena]MBK0401469.1 hypothetical protein [Adhaeribacter terrigena]